MSKKLFFILYARPIGLYCSLIGLRQGGFMGRLDGKWSLLPEAMAASECK